MKRKTFTSSEQLNKALRNNKIKKGEIIYLNEERMTKKHLKIYTCPICNGLWILPFSDCGFCSKLYWGFQMKLMDIMHKEMNKLFKEN